MKEVKEMKIGEFQNSIARLKLGERTLRENTLILGEPGSGKTHLASKIREFVIQNGIPTLYLDFSNPDIEDIESRFKKSDHFHYMRFDESEAFNDAFDRAIAERKDIYMAVDPAFFSGHKEVKSKLSKLLQKEILLENYYYFMHVISALDSFYKRFEDFIFYIFQLITMKKYGLTFLTQPNEIFENPRVKLLFTFLYLGHCSKAYYYNTAVLRSLPPHTFLYQERINRCTLTFSDIKSDIVTIDH